MTGYYLGIKKLIDLEQIFAEPIYISGKLEEEQEEIFANSWSISLGERLVKTIKVEDFAQFFEEMIKIRSKELLFMKPSMKATFYIWFEGLPYYLCFNILSGKDRELPFGCTLNVIDSPYSIFREFIKASYGNYYNNINTFQDTGVYKEEDDDDPKKFVIDVWKITLPWNKETDEHSPIIRNMKNVNTNIQYFMQEQLQFQLNDTEKIKIQVAPHDIVDSCYRAEIFFMHRNHKILLTSWMLNENIGHFKNTLEHALQNKLCLSNKFAHEIGYAWNFVRKKKTIPEMYSDETREERCQFNLYRLFENNNYTTWIYNDNQGNIYLKITPMFSIGKPFNRETRYKTFLSWMQKDYKPRVERVIPRSVVQQWLIQVNEIDDIINNNMKKV